MPVLPVVLGVLEEVPDIDPLVPVVDDGCQSLGIVFDTDFLLFAACDDAKELYDPRLNLIQGVEFDSTRCPRSITISKCSPLSARQNSTLGLMV